MWTMGGWNALGIFVALVGSPLAPASAVTVAWQAVSGEGNACDPQPDGCFGAVADFYAITRYEVTNADYAEFLNAVAAIADPNGLYNSAMGSPLPLGGIARSGTGPFTYTAVADRATRPVNWVSFYDALRYANWMHNGQLVGVEDATTTEDGAYTFSGASAVGPRNAGARVFLPSEDEWYKAAYYDASSASYFAYPAGTSAQTSCAAPSADANSANCSAAAQDLTEVGAYTESPSPSGTFDQGGDVAEWNEASIGVGNRGRRGGSASVSPAA